MDTNSIMQLPIESLVPNRFQPRLAFDDSTLNELAASIKEHGIIQPIVVRRMDDKYEIIAGERRYRAAKIAGLLSVPAILSNMTDQKSAEVAIVENIQRKDLTAIEEAKSYKDLLEKGLMSQEDLAKKMGLSQSAISNKLRLLNLDVEVQDAILNEKISERHARSLLKLKDLIEQKKMLKKIIDERLTVKMLEEEIKKVVPVEEVVKVEEVPMNNKPSFLEPKSYPNKFFNFMEDESANMNITSVENPSVTEEIEMLDDFLVEETLNGNNEETINDIKNYLTKYQHLVIEEIFENGDTVLKIKIPKN